MISKGALVAVCLTILGGLPPADAAPLTSGDILVNDVTFGPGRLREFTASGGLVQAFPVPAAPGGDTPPRDITVDRNGNVEIYNGTFSPFLTTLDPGAGTVIKNTTFPGWSTVNNITYGGIAAFSNFVFATDMFTFGGEPNGIIRFNVNDFSAVRFASGSQNGPGDYIQLTIGGNGLLYAEFPGTSPGGNHVDVFDPTTLAFQRRIDLGFLDLRSIAVDENGNIFAVSFGDRRIFEFDPGGNLLRAVNSPLNGFTDINIDANGRIVASSGFGSTILLTDESLASFSTFDPGTLGTNTFVAFVEPPLGLAVPEPATLWLLGVGVVSLSVGAWKQRRRRGDLPA
jgi:PEP-CTERM motif